MRSDQRRYSCFVPVCPNCQTELETVRQHDGVYFSCPKCGGHALTIPRITTLSGAEFSAKLLRKINVCDSFALHKCPFCEHEMLRFVLEDPPLGLEACHKCNLVWFGQDEFQHIPVKVVEPVHVTPQPIAEAIAVYHNQELQARLDLESPPDAAWKTVPAVLGLPVECDTTPLDRPPWATWILSATILVFSVLAFFNLRGAIDSFGFVPADAFRYGGLTFLTSFFVHGGIWHLVGNLYFLLIFGRKVENVLRPGSVRSKSSSTRCIRRCQSGHRRPAILVRSSSWVGSP